MRPGDWSLDLDALVLVPALALGYGLAARRLRPARWRVACLVAAELLLLGVFVTPLDSLASFGRTMLASHGAGSSPAPHAAEANMYRRILKLMGLNKARREAGCS